MSWLKIDDGFFEHEKIEDLSHAAFRLHVGALCICARLLTDGVVSETNLRKVAVTARVNAKRYVDELVDAKLWAPRAGGGWKIKDYLEYNPSREIVSANRESNKRRQALFRDVGLRELIRGRDGDRCRYCGIDVRWQDKRGNQGGTYDHIDPRGPNTKENVVVACRGCNSRKGGKTPEQAGMTLIQLRPIQNGFKSDSNQESVRNSTPYPYPLNTKNQDHITPLTTAEQEANLDRLSDLQDQIGRSI